MRAGQSPQCWGKTPAHNSPILHRYEFSTRPRSSGAGFWQAPGQEMAAQSMNAAPQPPVSIAIPARGATVHLRSTLGSVLAQDYRSVIEVIVADGSETPEMGIDKLTVIDGFDRHK